MSRSMSRLAAIAVFLIAQAGLTSAAEVKQSGRQTMGVWEEAMRRGWAWGLATVLVIGLTASRGLARDDDDEDTSQMKPPSRPAIRWSHYVAGMESYTLPKPEPAKKRRPTACTKGSSRR